jgi:2-iminobutanoate/2-iminopropanoate deaminase
MTAGDRVGVFCCLLTGVLFAGCGASDEAVRRIVHEELAAASSRSYHAPTAVIGPYSPAVKAGPLVFVSGQIALVPATGAMVQSDIEAETRQVLANVRMVLASAGCDSSDVVNATVYLKDMNNYQRVNAIYAGFFPPGKYPARVAVEVSRLPKDANVEISVVAVKSAK